MNHRSQKKSCLLKVNIIGDHKCISSKIGKTDITTQADVIVSVMIKAVVSDFNAGCSPDSSQDEKNIRPGNKKV